MGFVDKLKRNELIHYLGVSWKMRNDASFREKLIALYEKPDVLFFKHLGDEHPDKDIYLVYVNNAHRGFFSLFNLVLDGLEFSSYYNLTPVIEFGKDTLYHEVCGIDGILNSFEFYFKQPSNISVDSARKSKNVVFYEFTHRKLAIPSFNNTVGASFTDEIELEDYLNRRADIIRRYIHFSDRAQRYLDGTAESLIANKKTLGVHVRGTDMKSGYKGHATIVTANEYLEEAKKQFSGGAYEQIFLATDEADVVDLFEREFGEQLKYFKDILRSDDGKALHFSQNSRTNHKYLLGLEVLRDMYTLALSDGLIAGISNVSLAARMMKKSFGKEYNQINILSHGFNQTDVSMLSK